MNRLAGKRSRTPFDNNGRESNMEPVLEECSVATRKVVRIIKEHMTGWDERRMYMQMRRHYQILQLIDREGRWASLELQKLSSVLLPRNMTEELSHHFIDEMARAAERNPVLVRFLERANEATFDHLRDKVSLEGKEVIPDVIALALVFEKLTKAMYDHPVIIRDCVRIFEGTKADVKLLLFTRLKLVMIGGPVKRIFLKAHRTGRVPARAGAWMTPLNILVAAVADWIAGYRDNVQVGWTLAKHGPGAAAYDPRTGAGPASFSTEKKAICVAAPLPKEWADLYQNWNMAFISQIKDFVYLLPKLCIPQVAAYQERPTEYIYNRVLALYIYLHYSKFAKVEKTKRNEPYIQWNDRQLTELWGRVNAESAKLYETVLATHDRSR